jgi:hypothetical protein
MPTTPPKACNVCKLGICECAKQVAQQPPVALRWQPKTNATDRRYDTQAWRKFSRLLRDLNPVCLVIDEHGRCNRPSKVVHHLVSPHVDGSKFLSPANNVPICEFHHTPDEGEAADSHRSFAPTKWIMGAEYPHEKPKAFAGVRIGAGGVSI